jgi:hypothetical protein
MSSAKGGGDPYNNTNNNTPIKPNSAKQIAALAWHTICNLPYLESTCYFLLDFIFIVVKLSARIASTILILLPIAGILQSCYKMALIICRSKEAGGQPWGEDLTLIQITCLLSSILLTTLFFIAPEFILLLEFASLALLLYEASLIWFIVAKKNSRIQQKNPDSPAASIWNIAQKNAQRHFFCCLFVAPILAIMFLIPSTYTPLLAVLLLASFAYTAWHIFQILRTNPPRGTANPSNNLVAAAENPAQLEPIEQEQKTATNVAHPNADDGYESDSCATISAAIPGIDPINQSDFPEDHLNNSFNPAPSGLILLMR